MKLRDLLTTLSELAGVGLVVYAAWEVYQPAGLALLGAGLIGIGYVLARPR